MQRKEIDVLVIGSCMTDLITYTSRIPQIGETIHGHRFSIGFGGKGGNQCVAAAKLGARTALVAMLGKDSFGENYFKNLETYEIDITHVQMVNYMSGVAQICVEDSGNNNIVIVAGANEKLSCQDVEQAKKLIQTSKVVMFQLEVPVDATIRALELCRLFGCTSILNAAPAKSTLDGRLFCLSDIFCVNEIEAEIITGERITSVSDAKNVMKKFLQLGCKFPIITLGSEGVVFVFASEGKHCDPIHVAIEAANPAIDTTGAGDAFLGALGFFMSKFNNLCVEEMIKRSCEVAKHSVQRAGTQTSFPSKLDLPNSLFVGSN